MDSAKQRQNAKKFIKEWKGYEKGETQKFWISLLQDVLGIPQAVRLLDFEKQVVVDGQTKFIDAYIKPTKILIEQKGASIDLNKKYKQSGGAMLTPFEQAKRYAADLGKNLYPNYIVICNFKEFQIHDMSDPNAEPVIIKLEDLPTQVYRLAFLADVEKEVTAFEQKISVEAGEIVGEIYDALLAQYANPNNPDSLKSLNKLCVRLVFCLYAEDSGLFSTHLEFHDYLRKYSADARTALIQLFKVLNTTEDKRDPYLADDLLAFPYVNGGLFADEDIEIPKITPTIVELILKKASEGFDWSLISPTIFGAVFESTLNPETRRKGGMHYTSVENIHKVIDPLFLDELKKELEAARILKVPAKKTKRLEEFRTKLGSLTFLDPACGSGNFLTETYTSLRKLENEALRELYHGMMAFGEGLNPISVHINQFYGIEINDFAVTVARTALWIAESQMMKETEDIVGQNLDFLPLKSSALIHEGNALRVDWNEVISSSRLSYIIGNPPFVGHQHRSESQKRDMDIVFGETEENTGKIDYVGAWFKKSCDFIQHTNICCGLVATNSISQGESVGALWRPLFKEGIEIIFCYETFKWISEATENANVFCVIIGFRDGRMTAIEQKRIFKKDGIVIAKNINGYLADANNVFIENRSKPRSGMPKMIKGSQPTDDGNFFFTENEYKDFIQKYPEMKPMIRQFLGAREFINDTKRYCLWLQGIPESRYKKNKEIISRLKKIAEFRKGSPTESVRKDAENSALFTQIRQPNNDYLVVPSHTGEGRKYIPIGFVPSNIICGNANMLIPTDSKYIFGILESSVHMAWMRRVAGRLKGDYRYSPMVYNEFPWEKGISDSQKKKIEECAEKILEVREKYSDWSLFDLYGSSMPLDLKKAHEDNDRAVLKAYGLTSKATEQEIVSKLFELYDKEAKEIEQEKKKEEEKSKAASKKRSGKTK